MLGDAAAVTLLGDLVEPGFSDGKDGAEAFAEMCIRDSLSDDELHGAYEKARYDRG